MSGFQPGPGNTIKADQEHIERHIKSLLTKS
jgi:hypothetical protein